MRCQGLVCGILITFVFIRIDGRSQQGPQTPTPSQQDGMGGIASGAASAPVFDEQKRPITVGGFVDKGPVAFEDITKLAGLSG